MSASVGGLRANGGRIWVRLSSLVNDGWLFTDTSYLVAAGTAAAVKSTAEVISAAPAKVGSSIAGTFNDATGHSAQSHLVYAPNAGVWWLFTLSSAHDSFGDHTVRSYFSNGPNLTTATWTAAAPSPHLANAGFASDSVFAGGRSLGAAVLSIAGADYAHVFASAAFDGQVSSNGHIRARLGANAITWGAWNNPGSPNTASEWQGPANSGHPPSAASSHSSWGNVIGISTGGFIHHSSVTMDQEVDCNVGRSTNADVGATWTNGFGANAVGASPPNTDRRHRQVDALPVQIAGIRAAGVQRHAGCLQQWSRGAAIPHQPALPEVGRERNLDEHRDVGRRQWRGLFDRRDRQCQRLGAGARQHVDRLRVPAQGVGHRR